MSNKIKQCIKSYFQGYDILSNLLYKFPGDVSVADNHVSNGDYVWGYTVILLMFLPNIVFVLWFLNGNKKKLLQADTWAKVLVAGSIQLVTIIKYVYHNTNILNIYSHAQHIYFI
jgi:hypothetical protein